MTEAYELMAGEEPFLVEGVLGLMERKEKQYRRTSEQEQKKPKIDVGIESDLEMKAEEIKAMKLAFIA